MVKEPVIKNGFFSIIQTIIASLSIAIIYFIITINLGKSELGVWSIITSIPVAVSVFGTGVSGCILRYIPVYSAKEDFRAFNEILFNGFVFNLLLGGVFVILGLIFSDSILQFLFSVTNVPAEYTYFFKIALVTFCVNFISSVVSNALDGLQLIHVRNKIMILGSIVLCVSVWIFIGWGLSGVFYAQLIQSIIVIWLVCVALIKSSFFNIRHFKFNKIYIKLFVSYGHGYQLISICALFFDPITKYFLNRYFNLSTVGVYDMVNRMAMQIKVLIVGAIQVIIPRVSQDQAEGKLDLTIFYGRTTRGASIISACIFSTFICFGSITILQLGAVQARQYYCTALLISIAYYSNILASPAYSVLLGLGKLRSIIVSHFISTVLNLILFATLKNHLSNSFIAIPVTSSIVISSVYLLYSFKKSMKIVGLKIKACDFRIILMSLVSVSLTAMIVFGALNSKYLLLLCTIHTIIFAYLIFHNDLLSSAFRKIKAMILKVE